MIVKDHNSSSHIMNVIVFVIIKYLVVDFNIMTIGGYHVFRRRVRVSCDWQWWDHTICEQFHPSLTSWILLGTVVVFTLFHLRVRVAVQHQKIFAAASRYKRILFVPWNKNLLKWKIIIKCVRFIKLLKKRCLDII